MDNQTTPAYRFKKVTLELCEVIKEYITDFHNDGYNVVNPLLIEFAVSICESFDEVTMVRGFISRSYNSWGMVKNKTTQFFLDNASDLFGDLPCENVNAFASLFSITDSNGDRLITDEDEELLFSYIEALVKISISYMHTMMEPYTSVQNGKAKQNYKQNYIIEMKDGKNITINPAKILNLAHEWEINLNFGKL